MEKVIQEYNYALGTQRMQDMINVELWNCVEEIAPEIKIDGMEKIVAVFIQKVCVQPFPDFGSPGYIMSRTTVEMIVELMERCISTYKSMTKKQCQNLLFDLIVELIAKGQWEAHFQLMGNILQYLDMKDFIEGLKGEQLKRLLDALKQQKGMRDAGEFMTITEYAMGKENKEKRRDPDVHAQFLDFYIFFLVTITKKPPALASDLLRCQSIMWSKPYVGYSDVELYKRHIGIIKDVLSKDKFPRNRDEMDSAKEVFKSLLEGAANDNTVFKALGTDLAALIKELESGTKAKTLQPLIEMYRSTSERMTKDTIQSDSNQFETWAPKIIDILEKGEDTNTIDTVLSRQVLQFLKDYKPASGHALHWFKILKGFLGYPGKEASHAAKRVISENKLRKFWSWKKNIEEAKKIVIIANKAVLSLLRKKEENDISNICDNYGGTINELFEQLKFMNVSHLVMSELAMVYISLLEQRHKSINRMLAEFSQQLDFTKRKDLVPHFLKQFSVLYCDESYPWNIPRASRVGIEALEAVFNAYDLPGIDHVFLWYGTIEALEAVFNANEKSDELQPEVNTLMIKILNYAMDDNTERYDFESRSTTVYGNTVRSFLNTFITLHCEGETANQLIPLIPKIFKMMEDDDNDTTNAAKSAFELISEMAPKIISMKDDFTRLAKRYLDTLDKETLATLIKLYPHNTNAMAKLFQRIIGTLGKDKKNNSALFDLMWQVSENQPELFTKENVNDLSKYLDNEDLKQQVLWIWSKIVEKNPDLLLDQADVMMKHKDVNYIHYMQEILTTIAVKHKTYITPVLKWMIDWTKTDQDQMTFPVYIGMRKIADHFGAKPFAPYRKYLKELKAKKTSYVKDSVSNLIDVLENRSLEGVSKDVKKVQEDVEVLDDRVTGTEIVVGGVVQQVERHEGEIKDVQKGVADVNKRVDDVEEDLEEVKEKVEEIDMKTMSNAPTWSRDVTKLLNPASDHDWRLLASRLGYTNDDIRAWATQSDPCMALLSEWYATHKTREATSGVLNILQEMNRIDAAVIVENAMKQAEGVVEDEDFEYPSPPPVFLSYQWGHQNEVKLLRQHLQMAGYECWMDVGQMGGGDKLFEKIDAGIRGTKVVICCVSEKYAKSPNCNREVNLAVNLRKPMIPLQMEKILWPPEGSMGPIFSEYLYIRFYGGGGKGGKYWADTKFLELLMQLQMNNVVPDEKLITKEYRNWWIPVAEEIVIEKKDNRTSNKPKEGKSVKEDSKKGKDEPPDVFLSYQWDKQKQIQALYQKLTELGFRCWMDIHQMGGGDSLYDKIDRGVRGCKVMLSSVTSKYALSANCRREVSLADALRKPIIPLLLENTDWPPLGPMSLVFTRLLYINFCKDPNVQMKWAGKEFNELVEKVKGHVPEVFSDDTASKSRTTASKGKEMPAVTTKVKEEKQANTANFQVQATVARPKAKMSAVKVSEPIPVRKSSCEKDTTRLNNPADFIPPNPRDSSQNKSQDSSNTFQKPKSISKHQLQTQKSSITQKKQQERSENNPKREAEKKATPKADQNQGQTSDNAHQNRNARVTQDLKKNETNGSTNEKSSTCAIL